MNETVVAGRVKRAVIGLDLLITTNEVCQYLCHGFTSSSPFFLSFIISCLTLIEFTIQEGDIKMPGCTHKMGWIEIKRLPNSLISDSLERDITISFVS